MIGSIIRFLIGKSKVIEQTNDEIPIENKQEQIKITKRDQDMDLNLLRHIYIVTLDTTNRPEARQVFRREGIQNFYFVYAKANKADEEINMAKQIVLSTFARNAAVVNSAQYCLKATPIAAILGSLGPQRNFWTYIPMGGQRLAGQQAVPPSPDRLLRTNEYGDPTSKEVVIPSPKDVSPINKVNADDVVKKKAVEVNENLEMPTDPSQMTPEMMFAMMQKMMSMMGNQNQKKPAAPTKEELESVGEAVPFDKLPEKQKAKIRKDKKIQIGQDVKDPELEKQIQQTLQKGIPSAEAALGDIDMDDVDPNEFKINKQF